MSIIGYAAITNFRDVSAPGRSFTDAKDTTSAGSKKKYVDALAALVPGEVLGVHALVISFATKTENKVVTITEPNTLWWIFWLLCLVSLVLYVVPRAMGGRWDKWDRVRAFIPVLAFVGWEMLQPTSAFDTVASLTPAWRVGLAGSLALVLGVVAGALAKEVDQKQ